MFLENRYLKWINNKSENPLTLLVAGSWFLVTPISDRESFRIPLVACGLTNRYSKFKRNSISLNMIYMQNTTFVIGVAGGKQREIHILFRTFTPAMAYL